MIWCKFCAALFCCCAYLYWQPKTSKTQPIWNFYLNPMVPDGGCAQSNRNKAGTETCTNHLEEFYHESHIDRKFLIISCRSMTMAVYADTASSASLAGNYKCHDQILQIPPVTRSVYHQPGDTYTLEWDDSSGNPYVWNRNVDADECFIFILLEYYQSDNRGVESFTIKSDGSFTSQLGWNEPAKIRIRETCTKS